MAPHLATYREFFFPKPICKDVRRILKWMQRALFAAGGLMFVYCAVILIDAWIFQRRERRLLERIGMR